MLDVEHIRQQTGIPPHRIRALLRGAEPVQPPREREPREFYYRDLVSERLDYLRQRALAPADASGGRKFVTTPQPGSYRQIGSEVDLTHTLIEYLVKGKRSARVEYSSPLEQYYEVEHGYLSRPEGPALADYLKSQINGLYAGVLHSSIEFLRGGQMALRHTGEEPPSLRDMVTIMDALVDAERQRRDENPGDEGRRSD
ncbi:hypothetical protein AB0F77_31950 [Streptomyces sp. NPDC026672]|uniref:hypothetical protein n=1 Tax=unclassified Streptomyces TaxID=2593676 RepID=UPI0033D6F2D8